MNGLSIARADCQKMSCQNLVKETLHISGAQMRRLIELITGQNNLNYIQSKIFPGVIRELCRFCEEEDETFKHLLNEWPCFYTFRQDILQGKRIVKTLKWRAATLIKFSYIPSKDEALRHKN